MTRSERIIRITAAVFSIIAVAGVALASGGEGGGEHNDSGQKMDFIWRTVDFLILFAIVFWALKKANVKGMLAERQAGVEKALAEAREAREAAERKFAEYSEKLEKANKEIDEIYAAVRHEGETEKVRIVAEAKAMAEKIKEQAKQSADQEVIKARSELREEAARLAVELAAQNLKDKFTKEDQNRFVDEYLSKVVKLH